RRHTRFSRDWSSDVCSSDLEPGSHGNTYGGNALACAAAYEVLGLVEEELAANAARVGAHLMAGLKELQQRYEVIGDVRGRGLMKIGRASCREGWKIAEFA